MRLLSHPPKHLHALASPFLIFSAALAMRLVMMEHLLAVFGAHTLYLNNECARIASALVHGAGYSSPWSNMPVAPTAQQPPLYPLLLAGTFRVFGAYTHAAAVAALVINAIAAAATAVLLRYVGERCLGDRRAGLAAAWILALSPYEVIVGLQLWSQALSALLLVGLLWLLPALAHVQRKRHWFGLGCYSGAATLLNPALLPPFACAFAVRSLLPRRILLATAGLVLLLTPWTVRNYVQFGRFIPLRDNFAFELWVGNHEGLPIGLTMSFRGAFPAADLRAANWDEIKFIRQKGEQARRYILSHPGEFTRRCAWRVLQFWMIPSPVYWSIVTLLAWAGAVLAWRVDKSFLLILLTYPLVYYLTHVMPDYRFPIEPFMILLACYAALQAWSHAFGRPPVQALTGGKYAQTDQHASAKQ